MSFTATQDHKFSNEEKKYFLQHSWGKEAIAENDRLFPDKAGDAGADKPSDSTPSGFPKEIFEKVKAIPAEKLAEELQKVNLSTDGGEKDQRVRLATYLTEQEAGK